MSAMSNLLENEILDHILSVGSYTMPSAVYLGLSVASMGEAADGTELSGSGYARQAVTFSAASSGTTSNTGAVTFPTATGSWGSVGFWSIWDAASSGNMLLHGSFTSAKTIASGDVLRVSAGDLDITAA